MGVRIDVRLGRTQAQILHTVKRGDTLEDGVRQRLLKIVAARRCDLLHLRAEKVVVPCSRWIIIARGDILDQERRIRSGYPGFIPVLGFGRVTIYRRVLAPVPGPCTTLREAECNRVGRQGT